VDRFPNYTAAQHKRKTHLMIAHPSRPSQLLPQLGFAVDPGAAVVAVETESLCVIFAVIDWPFCSRGYAWM
jgi:hypothetical protein